METKTEGADEQSYSTTIRVLLWTLLVASAATTVLAIVMRLNGEYLGGDRYGAPGVIDKISCVLLMGVACGLGGTALSVLLLLNGPPSRHPPLAWLAALCGGSAAFTVFALEMFVIA
jgi:hypothetical protein